MFLDVRWGIRYCVETFFLNIERQYSFPTEIYLFVTRNADDVSSCTFFDSIVNNSVLARALEIYFYCENSSTLHYHSRIAAIKHYKSHSHAAAV